MGFDVWKADRLNSEIESADNGAIVNIKIKPPIIYLEVQHFYDLCLSNFVWIIVYRIINYGVV